MTESLSRRNLELKVQVSANDLDGLLERTRQLVCAPLDHLHQIDTYLKVPRGRLKLREMRDLDQHAVVLRAELIGYARQDQEGSRWSHYEVVPVAADHAAALLRALLMTHDELARIDKQRTVGLIGQTRVHLDRVVGLGAFVELETVISSQDDATAQREHDHVISALGLGKYPVVAGSYSDLALVRE